MKLLFTLLLIHYACILSCSQEIVKEFSGFSTFPPARLTGAGSLLYFAVHTPETGFEPWVSDGTTAGTRLLKDINTGSGSSDPANFTILNDKVIFTAADIDHGEEIWITDGTAEGTRLLKDINPGPQSSYPAAEPINYRGVGGTLKNGFKVLNGHAFFPAADPIHGRELWTTDGTDEGTFLLKDMERGTAASGPWQLTVSGFQFFFAAYTVQTGFELWKSDGTTEGTTITQDIYENEQSSQPLNLVSFKDKIYFNIQNEIWVSDGTDEGTGVFFTPKADSGYFAVSPYGVTEEYLYFAGVSADRSSWYTFDGTERGPVFLKSLPGFPVKDFKPVPVIGSVIILNTTDGSSHSLYSSDGTESGTVLVASSTSPISQRAGKAEKLFLALSTSFAGNELWQTDGTQEGTSIVRDILPGPQGSFPFEITSVEGNLYFIVRQPGSLALWKYSDDAVLTVPENDNDRLNVKGESEVDDELCFYDMQGRFLLKVRDKDDPGINILAPGLYIARYNSGQRYQTYKFVK